jgi:hypothetical protein
MGLPTTYSWVISTPTAPLSGATSGNNAGNRTSGNGKTGIAIPFSADGRGRLALCSGPAQLRKIIIQNLSDCESLNPFQDLGIGAEMVFAINSTKLRQDIKRKINELFKRLQLADRARLNGPPTFKEDLKLMNLEVSINYIDLVENKPGDVGITFSLQNSVSNTTVNN